jgi:hypothetical protein
MKNVLGSRRRPRLLAIVVGLCLSSPLLAQTLPFAGRWLPDDNPEAPATKPTLIIKGTRLSWRGPDKTAPVCVQEFVLKNEKPGTVYTDGRGTRFVAGVPGSIPTYLLKLSASTCGGVDEDVRIRFPLVYDINHIEFIEYVGGKPVSSRRFRRKK